MGPVAALCINVIACGICCSIGDDWPGPGDGDKRYKNQLNFLDHCLFDAVTYHG